jgi:hypothetical protein
MSRKVHAVELELLAERLVVHQSRKVLVGRNVGKDVEDFLANFSSGHADSNLWIMTTELIPSIPNELLRI